ncbi:MAG: hypothetical protein K2M70_09975 [Lachnospiraceae bacterium]|nr:hypothetical protein [Lachnospiraceae bacterium]
MTEGYRIGQLILGKSTSPAKKMLEKTENDRQFVLKCDGIRREVTTLSMWITLWKLRISRHFCVLFQKNESKKCGKVDKRILVYKKRNLLGQLTAREDLEKRFDAEQQIVVY